MSDAVNNAALHPELRAVKQRFADYLYRKFGEMFDSADDTLFSSSSGGASADAQGTYFDALRQLRIRKDELIQAFRGAFDAGFAKAIGVSRNVAAGAGDGKSAGLSLVGHGDLEESLAFTNVIERAQRRYADGLYALAQRFNELLAGGSIDERSLPIGPNIVSEAFRATVDEQPEELKVEIKLVLLKLFDKCVVQELGPAYDDINGYLAGQGVLPEIKVVIRKNAESSPTPAREAQQESAGGAEGAAAPAVANDGLSDTVADVASAVSTATPSPNIDADASSSSGDSSKPATVTVDVSVFEKLTRVFAAQNNGSFSGALLANSGVEVSGETTADSAQATKQLVAALSQIQNQAAGAPSSEAFFGAGLAQMAIATLRDIQKTQGAKPVSLVDANTIDVVSLMFGYILDDASIPGSLRALISKLQLPYLKVGLLDKEFFNNQAHPARHLLNELARAGNGWREADDPKDDPLYKKVGEIVDRTTREFVDDVGLFQILLDDFSAFLSEERAMDDTKELIIGKSRNDVREVIEKTLSKRVVPAFVREFLVGPWKDVLVRVHEKKGFRSETWNKSVQIAEELIGSVQTQQSAEQRARLTKQLPVLLNVMRAGLKSISYPESRAEAFFQNLETLHITVLQGKSVKQSAEPAITGAIGSKKTSATEAAAPSEEQLKQAAARKEAEEFVKVLKTGDWLEFTDDEGNPFRGKLIWRSDVLDDFTFVNRAYKVVAERRSAELVQEFLDGRTRRLENVPLIDRALDAVIRRVKG